MKKRGKQFIEEVKNNLLLSSDELIWLGNLHNLSLQNNTEKITRNVKKYKMEDKMEYDFKPKEEKKCELCERKVINPVLYEDDLVWITTCKTCDVPMAVWKTHKVDLIDEEKNYIKRRLLMAIGGERDDEYIDDIMHTTPDHYHIHLRKKQEE